MNCAEKPAERNPRGGHRRSNFDVITEFTGVKLFRGRKFIAGPRTRRSKYGIPSLLYGRRHETSGDPRRRPRTGRSLRSVGLVDNDNARTIAAADAAHLGGEFAHFREWSWASFAGDRMQPMIGSCPRGGCQLRRTGRHHSSSANQSANIPFFGLSVAAVARSSGSSTVVKSIARAKGRDRHRRRDDRSGRNGVRGVRRQRTRASSLPACSSD